MAGNTYLPENATDNLSGAFKMTEGMSTIVKELNDCVIKPGIESKNDVEALAKKLKNRTRFLQILHRVVTTSNSQPSDCVLIDKTQDGRQQIGKRKVYPHVIACQLWRWPDVVKSELARATDDCKWSFFDRRECTCINPYHYIRIKPTNESDNVLSVNQTDGYSCRYSSGNYLQPNKYNGNYEMHSPHGESVADIATFLGNSTLTYVEETIDLDPLLQNDNSGYFGDALATADLFFGMNQGLEMLSQAPTQLAKNDESILPTQTPTYQFSSNSPTFPQSSYNYSQSSPSFSQNSNYSQVSPASTSQPSPLMNNSPLHNSNSPSIQPQSPNFVIEDDLLSKKSPVYQPSSPAQFTPAQTSPATYQQTSVSHQQPATTYQQPSISHQQNAAPTYLQLSQAQPNLSCGAPMPTNSGLNYFPPRKDMPIKMPYMNPMPREVEPEYWCSIKYYEFEKQVGEIFRAKWSNPVIRVDGGTDPQCGMRFCLGALSNPLRSEKSTKVRLHIGHGITFEHHMNGDVWLKCNPEYNVFIKSHYLDSCRNTMDAAHRMPEKPNDYLRIFDLEHCKRSWNNYLMAASRAAAAQASAIAGIKLKSDDTLDDSSAISCDSMLKLCTLRVSFMKGWGPNYPNYPTIEDTPCWIEILLDKPAKILDEWLVGGKSRGRF